MGEVKQEEENDDGDEDSLQRIQRMVYGNLDDDDDESSSSSEQEEESSSEQEDESVEDVLDDRQRLVRLSPIPGSPAPGPQDASSPCSSNITYNAEEIESID